MATAQIWAGDDEDPVLQAIRRRTRVPTAPVPMAAAPEPAYEPPAPAPPAAPGRSAPSPYPAPLPGTPEPRPFPTGDQAPTVPGAPPVDKGTGVQTTAAPVEDRYVTQTAVGPTRSNEGDAATAQTATATTPPAPGTRYAWQTTSAGQAIYNQVYGLINQNFGRAPTPEEVWNTYLNWDRAPDAAFLQKIAMNIYAQPEAVAHRKAQDASTSTASTSSTAAPGSVGHDGVWNGMTREQWRDAWMSAGPMTSAQMDQWMAAHGATKAGGSGRFTTPFGETGDLGIGYSTGQVTPGWTFADAGGGSAGSGGASGAGGSAAGGSASFQDQTRQMLLDLMNQYSKPVTADDPAIKGELQSQARGIERNRVAKRGADAERAAFQGLLNGGQSSGAFDTDVAAGFENAGSQFNDVQAQLFSRELTNRRDNLQTALALAVQTGDNELARSLQLQIANMNADIARAQMAQQWNIHNDDYGLAAAEAQRQRDLDAANAKKG